MKMLKDKNKEEILKASREKRLVRYKEASIRLTANLSSETMAVKRHWNDIFKVLGFPSGAVVKNPPANAGDTGSSPGPRRSHMPQSN